MLIHTFKNNYLIYIIEAETIRKKTNRLLLVDLDRLKLSVFCIRTRIMRSYLWSHFYFHVSRCLQDAPHRKRTCKWNSSSSAWKCFRSSWVFLYVSLKVFLSISEIAFCSDLSVTMNAARLRTKPITIDSTCIDYPLCFSIKKNTRFNSFDFPFDLYIIQGTSNAKELLCKVTLVKLLRIDLSKNVRTFLELLKFHRPLIFLCKIFRFILNLKIKFINFCVTITLTIVIIYNTFSKVLS